MMVRQRFRGLFQKYLLVLFMAVAIPLAINGVIEAWLGYRDQLARLDQLLGVQATSAAAEIQGFIDGITNELGWLVQLPWTDDPDERRRVDTLRLLRQAACHREFSHSSTIGDENAFTSRVPASIELTAALTDPPIPQLLAPTRPGSGLAT